MKKIFIVGSLLFVVFMISGCSSTDIANFSCGTNKDSTGMKQSDALKIAQASDCNKEGLTAEISCNENTRTWWIDLKTKKEGCSPACVIDVEKKTAEINWRCTGLKN
ncbi:MAG: hypothetical protein PHN19_01830 [Patescibacteria group bacterium]|nr:hypothetical protein [Patescibacteria group bacterium]